MVVTHQYDFIDCFTSKNPSISLNIVGDFILSVEALDPSIDRPYLLESSINLVKIKFDPELIIKSQISKAIKLKLKPKKYKIPNCYKVVDYNLNSDLYGLIIVSNISRYEILETFEFEDLGSY